MTLTTGEQVRLRIADRWRFGEEVRAGDGTAQSFKLAQGAPFGSLVSASAYVPAAGGGTATGATFDTARGTGAVPSAISANSAWRADYLWAVFSDEEIGLFTALGGTVPGAALQAIRSLRFDGLRRAKWKAPDGTEYDDTAALRELKALEDSLKAERAGDGEPAGGIESWAEQQQFWSSDYSG